MPRQCFSFAGQQLPLPPKLVEWSSSSMRAVMIDSAADATSRCPEGSVASSR